MAPKLNAQQVREIKDEPGSLRELAEKYGVSHTAIRYIKEGWREPKEKKPPRKRYTTGIGTVVKARLVSPRLGHFSLDMRLPARHANVIVGQIEEAMRVKIAEVKGLRTDYKVYEKQSDGSVVFKFRKHFGEPLLTNVAGNKLRKPERVTTGRRVSVTYHLVPWYLPDNLDESWVEWQRELRYPGVGVILSLEALTLFSGKAPRK
jgi:hypothetical protein